MKTRTVDRSWKTAVAVGAIATSATFALSTPAAASPSGAISFYTNANYTGQISSTRYTGCDATRVFPLRQVASAYNNRPADGCRVQVSVPGSTWLTLCEGKHVLPVAYRDAPTVRVTAGSTPQVCATA